MKPTTTRQARNAYARAWYRKQVSTRKGREEHARKLRIYYRRRKKALLEKKQQTFWQKLKNLFTNN